MRAEPGPGGSPGAAATAETAFRGALFAPARSAHHLGRFWPGSPAPPAADGARGRGGAAAARGCRTLPHAPHTRPPRLPRLPPVPRYRHLCRQQHRGGAYPPRRPRRARRPRGRRQVDGLHAARHTPRAHAHLGLPHAHAERQRPQGARGAPQEGPQGAVPRVGAADRRQVERGGRALPGSGRLRGLHSECNAWYHPGDWKQLYGDDACGARCQAHAARRGQGSGSAERGPATAVSKCARAAARRCGAGAGGGDAGGGVATFGPAGGVAVSRQPTAAASRVHRTVDEGLRGSLQLGVARAGPRPRRGGGEPARKDSSQARDRICAAAFGSHLTG